MTSFITVKKLSVLTKGLLKSEIVNVFLCTDRSLYTKSASFTSCIFKQKFTIAKLKNYVHSQSTPKDLGKVVDIDLNFDDVRIDEDEEINCKKRKKNKKKFKGLPARGDNKLTEEHKTTVMEDLHFSDDIIDDYAVDKKGIKENKSAKCSLERDNKMPNVKETTKSEEKNKGKGRGYEDLGRNSALFGSVMSKLKSKKSKENSRFVLLEGKRLIHDALAVGLTPSQIFFNRASNLEEINLPDTVEVFRVPYKILKLWSDVVSSQGVVGIFELKKNKPLKPNTSTIPVTVICNNITDPGNLGSIMRVVAAAGCEKLILTQGCVDVWGSKVLRAGAGAHFRFPISETLSWKDIEREIEEESKILLADISINKDSYTSSEKNKEKSWSYSKSSEISEFLPESCYHSIEYKTSTKTVIVIGGETYGLSDEAYQFAANRSGTKVFIPMNNGIESLNTSMALGIILYEIRRQLCGATDEDSVSS